MEEPAGTTPRARPAAAARAAAPAPPPFYDRRRRRWPWVVLVVGVLVLALGLAFALRRSSATVAEGSAPGPAAGPLPTIAPPAPGEHEGFALDGSGGAVVYLQSPTAIQRADLGSGATALTATPELTGVSTLVAGTGWVLSKAVDTPSGVLVRDGGGPQLLPIALQQAGRVYPGGPDQVWVLPADPVAGFRTAVAVDLQGNRVGETRIRVPAAFGTPAGHLGGEALVLSNAEGTYEARPEGVRRVSRGVLLGVGTDALLTWDCDVKNRCDARTNRAGKPPEYLPAVHTSLLGLYRKDMAAAAGSTGVLSPDRRWVALDLPTPTRSGASLVLVDLRSGHRVEVPGAMARASRSDQAAWTPNGRYLLALTDGRLRAFDRTTEKVLTLAGTPAGLVHLTIAGTATM